jgi:hypothetical protein
MDQSIVERFRALEKRLTEQFPLIAKEAEALAAGIADPQTANADAIWERAWNKPLYANTKVEFGDSMRGRLKPYMAGSWQHWGLGGDSFYLKRDGKGAKTDNLRQRIPSRDRSVERLGSQCIGSSRYRGLLELCATD